MAFPGGDRGRWRYSPRHAGSGRDHRFALTPGGLASLKGWLLPGRPSASGGAPPSRVTSGRRDRRPAPAVARLEQNRPSPGATARASVPATPRARLGQHLAPPWRVPPPLPAGPVPRPRHGQTARSLRRRRGDVRPTAWASGDGSSCSSAPASTAPSRSAMTCSVASAARPASAPTAVPSSSKPPRRNPRRSSPPSLRLPRLQTFPLDEGHDGIQAFLFLHVGEQAGNRPASCGRRECRSPPARRRRGGPGRSC